MQGCVTMFNAAVRDLMLRWEGDLAMHDHLLHLIGLAMGNVTYIHTPLMLYRQHVSNVTGLTKTKILNTDTIMRNWKIPVVDKKHYDSIRQFVTQYGPLLDYKYRSILNIYLNLPSASLVRKIVCIVRKRFRIYDSSLLLVIKILFRPYMR